MDGSLDRRRHHMDGGPQPARGALPPAGADSSIVVEDLEDAELLEAGGLKPRSERRSSDGERRPAEPEKEEPEEERQEELGGSRRSQEEFFPSLPSGSGFPGNP